MTFWRGFFHVAAAFNGLAGLPLLIVPRAMLAVLGLAVPSDLIFHRLAGLLIVSLGVVMLFVAHDPRRYRPILWVAAVAKLAVVALFTHAWLHGEVSAIAFAVALGDLAFAVAFLVFLLAGPRPDTASPAA